MSKPASGRKPWTRPGFVMETYGPIQETGREFDITYWQAQGDAAIFRAAWELVILHNRMQGKGDEVLRLQRSIEEIRRA